jgi:O-antigen/teichoic acid export membrane protein
VDNGKRSFGTSMFFNLTTQRRSLVRRLRQSLVARNTAAMLAGSGTRLLIQGVYFVLIARALGPEQYGAFVGVVALVAILAPFAPLGTGQLLVRNVARERETFGYSWGNALWMTSVAGSLLIGLTLLLARYILAATAPLALVLLVACSDLVLAAVVNVGALAFVAVEELHSTARIYVAMSGARAAGALVLIVSVRHPTALSWGFFYFLSSAAAAVYAGTLVCSRLGYPRLSLRRLRSDLIEGFYFSIGLSAQSIYNDIDKTMLVRLATFSAAGVYAAAYRVVDLSFQPISALLSSTFPRFFRRGTEGLVRTRLLVMRFLPFAAAYAILAGILMVLAAPVLPLVLGRGFGLSVEALRWLSPLVLLRAVHYFFSNSLTCADLQGLRSAIQALVAGANVLLNLWLIPGYSWRGAAWASLASDGLLAACMFLAVCHLARREELSGAACGTQPRAVQ